MNAQPGLRLCCSHATKSSFLLRVNVYIAINVYLIKKVKFKKIIYVFIHDIVSSCRPSDVGSTVTNCSCTLLIGHMEPKSV